MGEPAELFDLGAVGLSRLLGLLGRPGGPAPAAYTEILRKKAGIKAMTGSVEDHIRRAILEAFPEFGRAPTLTEISAATRREEARVLEALDVLDRLDLVVGNSRGQVLAAYPFSGIATSYRVLIESAKPDFALCAISALGVPYMLRRDVTVESCCAACGRSIRVRITRGNARVLEPPEPLVWVPDKETYAMAAANRCPLMSFFCDKAELQSGHTAGEPGVALTLDQAAETAKVIFWDFLYDRTTPHP